MADYEYLYCIAIHGMLKERINAGIRVTIQDDNLIIYLKNDDDIFIYTVYGITDKIVFGYDKEIIVCKVVERYKRYILRKYFY